MNTEVLMNWMDKAGFNFQLYRDDLDYVISSDSINVSKWGGGCYYCIIDTEEFSEALLVFSRIVKNAEENNGKVDTKWLVETFGKGTC
jgi:hypothetical protein